MYPLFFGNPDQSLYGMYHMPELPGRDGVGVVLCNPVLNEYSKSHRAFCVLAERLAMGGLHALRFDYHGTGDSCGTGEEAELDRWVEDIGRAIDELVASRGVKRVGLIGLRLGATMAALASERRDDVEFLVLWDPIANGGHYVDGLRELHQIWLTYESENQPNLKRKLKPHELLGHPFLEAFERDLRGIELSGLASCSARRVLFAAAAEGEPTHSLEARFEELGAAVDRRVLEGHSFVRQGVQIDQAKVPRDILTSIVDWVAGQAS